MSKPYDQAKIDRLRRLAETHGLKTAAEIVGVSERGIQLMRRRGWTVGTSRKPRPVPTDYRIQSAHMSVHQLKAHYRAGLSTIRRWNAETNRTRLPGFKTPSLPVPYDLAAIVAQLGPVAAASHYAVSDDTLLKWRHAAGLPIAGQKPQRKPWRWAA